MTSIEDLKILAAQEVPTWSSHNLSTWLNSASALQKEAFIASDNAEMTQERDQQERAYILQFRLCKVFDIISKNATGKVLDNFQVGKAIEVTRRIEQSISAQDDETLRQFELMNSLPSRPKSVQFEDAFPSLDELEEAMPIKAVPQSRSTPDYPKLIISPQQLVSLVSTSNSPRTLLLDLRSRADWTAAHIPPPNEHSICQAFDSATSILHLQTDITVLYDDHSTHWSDTEQLESVLASYRSAQTHESNLSTRVFLLQGGWQAWSEHTNSLTRKPQVLPSRPLPSSSEKKTAHRRTAVFSDQYATIPSTSSSSTIMYPMPASTIPLSHFNGSSYSTLPFATGSSSGLARPTYPSSSNQNKLANYSSQQSYIPTMQPLARPNPSRHSSDLYQTVSNPNYNISSMSSSNLSSQNQDPISSLTQPYAIQYPSVKLPPQAASKSSSKNIATSNLRAKTKRLPESQIYYWGNDRIGLSGLKNLGNTCYMNSTLQCLSATAPFARYFRSGQWVNEVNRRNTMGTRGLLAKAFAEIITVLWKEDYQFISPLSFRKAICSFAPHFDGDDQHDAQEFLSFLLDGLHEDLNRNTSYAPPESQKDEQIREDELETLPLTVAADKEWARWKLRNDSLCVDWFQGQFRNRLECLSCHKTSTTFNTFMYLSLPIPSKTFQPKVSLTHCLDLFCKEETLEKDNAWHCPSCKQPRKATKKLSLSRLPPVLLIHLKRFSFKNSDKGDKIDTTVTYPLKGLDLTDYIPSPPIDFSGGHEVYDDPSVQIAPYKYDLYAVTEHHGNLSSGHYTAYILNSQGWQYAADSKTENVHNENHVKSKEAYVLYYKRVKPDR